MNKYCTFHLTTCVDIKEKRIKKPPLLDPTSTPPLCSTQFVDEAARGILEQELHLDSKKLGFELRTWMTISLAQRKPAVSNIKLVVVYSS